MRNSDGFNLETNCWEIWDLGNNLWQIPITEASTEADAIEIVQDAWFNR